MIPREALAVLELVEIEWPSAEPLPDETKKAWAFELQEFDIETARDAVRDLARFQRFRPALSELLDACYEQRKLNQARFALPAPVPPSDGPWISFRDWYDTQTAEMQARARKVFTKLHLPGEDPE